MSRPTESVGQSSVSMDAMLGRPSALAAEFVPSQPAAPTRYDARSAPFQPQPVYQYPYRARARAQQRRAAPRPYAPAATYSYPFPPDMYANPAMRDSARTDVAMLLARPHPAMAVPDTIGQYYAVLPLESAPSPLFADGGPAAVLYKGVSASQGAATALLRVIGAPPAPSAQIVRVAEAWKRVHHPTILALKEAFTTRQFTANTAAAMPPTNEVVFAYEFASRSDTVRNVFLNAPTPDHRYHPLGEATLWAMLSQLLSAISVVHANSLSLRDALTTCNLLVTGRNRVRISCTGLSDAFDLNGVDHIPQNSQTRLVNPDRTAVLQRADLASLGRILATLALRGNPKLVRSASLVCGEDIAVEALRRASPYSEDLALVVATLLNAAAPTSQLTINEVLSLVGPRMASELGNVWTHCDSLENKLFVEFDSSRMFRLMSLLGFVNERADAGVEPQWSETGDRYLLKLFRDYVFHRVDSNGNSILDMAHVVECLSRLDVGSPEQVLLSSRDGSSLLVATYEDLRRCLLQAVDELRSTRHGLPAR